MNKLIFNYKHHVEKVLDSRTFGGITDLGFRQYVHSAYQISGLEFPSLRGLQGQEKKEAIERLKRAEKCLSIALLTEDDLPHGRCVILAPQNPDKYGRVYVNVYIPCINEVEKYQNMLFRYAGYRLINVYQYMKYLEKNDFNIDEARTLLSELAPYDFDK